MVIVTHLVKHTHIPLTFAQAHMEPHTRIHIPVVTHDGFVADVTGTYIMLRIVQALQPSSECEQDAEACDQDEPYDALEDAWSRCRNEPFDPGCPRWVTEVQVQECVARARALITSYGEVARLEFEVPVALEGVVGRADCVVRYAHGEMIVFEFKCVQELSERHRAQTAVYAHMLRHVADRGRVRGVLFNVLTNDIQEIFTRALPASFYTRPSPCPLGHGSS